MKLLSVYYLLWGPLIGCYIIATRDLISFSTLPTGNQYYSSQDSQTKQINAIRVLITCAPRSHTYRVDHRRRWRSTGYITTANLYQPKIFIVNFLFLAAARQCRQRHEIYRQCGTACPETCDSIKLDGPIICTANCVSGCFCKSGYVRNLDNGRCIFPEYCPSVEKVRDINGDV
ncbi:hypothetical protein RP20_CCG017354 [Aedes albopictus]|nr:hypothetical protein RP20_CCG017354 [Aedes albopictus]